MSVRGWRAAAAFASMGSDQDFMETPMRDVARLTVHPGAPPVAHREPPPDEPLPPGFPPDQPPIEEPPPPPGEPPV